ncbi:MAG TPA: FkbM family methyltransferase [Verrucomicrobiae bacterium]|jgi:FkbM family methyltransferase|nr:FkbM family methyltransferase [Verrucomicrobiae bacterium]
MSQRRVRLRCGFSLGDIVALTGAVRELHEQFPGQFLTDVSTSCPQVWWHNPYVTRLCGAVQTIDCSKVLIDRTGASGQHYIGAYLELFNRELGVNASLRRTGGDIHLSKEEKGTYSDVWTFCRKELPFWIICSGGKFDLPIKWWSHQRYQRVVDHFQGRIQFVQIGTWGNYHPRLKGTIDLRGTTGIRDLIHLVYYAQGVFCGVTSLMHLAAAVPTEFGQERQAVIIAGAREPEVWEKYPAHHFFSTSKAVECAHCWKHRHIPLPDRRGNKRPEIVCSTHSNGLPRCMDLVSAERVIEAIEAILRKGYVASLTKEEATVGVSAASLSESQSTFDRHNITPVDAPEQASRFIQTIPCYPAKRFSGRGIVICGGGVNYFANAWVCINMLRLHGCHLPIELWYIGRAELDRKMEALAAPLGVSCVNAREIMNRHPFRNPLGWELKCYALLHSRFEEVLFLDADNVPVRNPEFLFASPEFLATGALFWPDFRRLSRQRPIWRLCGVKYRAEPEFESGQMVLNKRKCWRPLNLALWYNDHSEFFYRYIHGDKETFHLAWRRLNAPYSMTPFPIQPLRGTMCQHDFNGERLFQHRNLVKWQFFGENVRVPGFHYEAECLLFLEKLRSQWDGKINNRRETIEQNGFTFRKGTLDQAICRSVSELNEYALPARFNPDDVIIDVGGHIGSFSASCHARGSRSIHCFEANAENYEFARRNLKALAGVRVSHKAVLHMGMRVETQAFPKTMEGQNTGGGAIFVHRTGSVQAIALDEVLRKVKRCRLLKLDCEGSEWPILLYSKELWRVQSIRGEFHEMQKHELCPDFPKLNRELLRALLKKHFRTVKTALDKANPKLGKFWASEPRDSRVFQGYFRQNTRTSSPTATTQIDAAGSDC